MIRTASPFFRAISSCTAVVVVHDSSPSLFQYAGYRMLKQLETTTCNQEVWFLLEQCVSQSLTCVSSLKFSSIIRIKATPSVLCLCLHLHAYTTVTLFVILFQFFNYTYYCRSQWPRGLRRRSATDRLLRSWVRIPPGAWMFVCCDCCVLSGRGLCDELITRAEESYRLWCIVVCDLETSRIGAPYIYIYMTLVA